MNSCINPHVNSYTRYDPETFELVKKWEELARRYHLPNGGGLAFVLPSQDSALGFFNATEQALPRSVVLHEVGHLMGLCDQYQGAITKCARTTKPVRQSVMFTAWKFTELQEDDKEGIRMLLADITHQTVDMQEMTAEEQKIFQEQGMDALEKYVMEKQKDSPFFICNELKKQNLCEAKHCVWDQNKACLSPLLSPCEQATEEKSCMHLNGCRWVQQEDKCMFIPFYDEALMVSKE